MAITSNELMAACRYMLENQTDSRRLVLIDTTLTFGIVSQLQSQLLVDGPNRTLKAGQYCRLSGLGVKAGEEAIRLGIAAIAPAAVFAAGSPSKSQEVCNES